jgi:hypothetical protein
MGDAFRIGLSGRTKATQVSYSLVVPVVTAVRQPPTTKRVSVNSSPSHQPTGICGCVTNKSVHDARHASDGLVLHFFWPCGLCEECGSRAVAMRRRQVNDTNIGRYTRQVPERTGFVCHARSLGKQSLQALLASPAPGHHVEQQCGMWLVEDAASPQRGEEERHGKRRNGIPWVTKKRGRGRGASRRWNCWP